MDINMLTGIVINLCIKIDSAIGPGCFEKVYENILYHKLSKLGFKVQRQVLVPVELEELRIENACKLDLLVEDMFVLELKSVSSMPPVYFK